MDSVGRTGLNSLIDLTGRKYGRLRVTPYAGRTNEKTVWLCRCACGNMAVVNAQHLKNGHTRSCGCLWLETIKANVTKHGLTYSSEYSIWCNMKRRCYGTKVWNYKSYGGRGITVCRRWLGKDGFTNFYADMGPRPNGLTLDRKDSDGNYEPNNCRWATKSQQSRNRRNTVFIFDAGVNRPFTEWMGIADRHGISPGTLRMRIRAGWPIGRAVTEPTRVRIDRLSPSC